MRGVRNYDDVVTQLMAAGLRPDLPLEITGELKRTKVDGDREKRGWYVLHELPGDGGGLIVGSFGIWRGSDNNATKVAISKDERGGMSPEQASALRDRLREDRKRAEAARKARAERAARRAESVWRKCLPTPPEDGACDYLTKKNVGAHGVRYTPGGGLAIAMHDAMGRVRGLQFVLDGERQAKTIRRIGRKKTYWPPGVSTTGNFFLIGSPRDLVLVVEGYATAATLHEASGHPVAVAFDAGNLAPVVKSLRKRYRDARILVCADDDYLTDGNPGITAASAAALSVQGAAWAAPVFTVDRAGRKLTDFNDLQALEGLLPVRAQIEARVDELGWTGGTVARDATDGGEGKPSFRFDLDVLMRDFTLIYGTDTVFDGQRKKVLGLGPLRSAAGKSLVRMWLEHPDRKIVDETGVGFDPAETDKNIACNLWAGWPSVPKRGSCERLLELLAYLTNHDPKQGPELFSWVMRWLAYPIQNPGAKMQTALLMHGPEGTGKNTFFNTVRGLYGRYGTQFSQVEVESKFNDWASGKLFAIGNEVVSRAELYHIQGRLKSMITESEWIINPKNLPTRQEANHCNFVFFSNRIDIAKLDPDDRRYCVIWTPPKLTEDFYVVVREELDNGGAAALHEELLGLDMTGFGAHTAPPYTAAKSDLVELSMDSTERFWRAWRDEHIDGIPFAPCRSTDLYDLYRLWAGREGIGRAAQKQTLLTALGKKSSVVKRQERFENGSGKEKKVVVYPAGDVDAPQGVHKGSWLGNMLHDFSVSVAAYRDD